MTRDPLHNFLLFWFLATGYVANLLLLLSALRDGINRALLWLGRRRGGYLLDLRHPEVRVRLRQPARVQSRSRTS